MNKSKHDFQETDFGLLPTEWDVKTIEEVCEILDSKRVPLNKEQRASMKGDIPYYGANGVVDFINDYIFDEPLILMAEDGGYFDEYQTRPIAYKVKGKCWVNNHAHILRPKISESLDWIYYSLVHKNILNYISGGTRAKLNQSQLKQIPLAFPPIQEQRKIAAILTSVDNAIEKTEEIIEQTEKVKKGLMQQLLTRGIGHTKFKETEIGEIPEEWEVKPFDEILIHVGSGITPKGGSKVYLDKGIPFIRSQNVYPEGLILDDIVYISSELHEQMRRSKVLEGDVLLNITGASIGRCTFLPQGFGEANVNQHVCILRPDKNKVITEYLTFFINSFSGQKQIQNEQSGQTREGLNYQQIRGFVLPLPSLREQQEIVKILSMVVFKYQTEKRKLMQLQTLKKGLMQVLLTGKVRVKVDEEQAVST